MLAAGRLAAAEDALYGAVRARPRAPESRGELGLYLASRGRFRIAEVLLEEARRFGADSGSVLRAIAAMAPYRTRASGPAVEVPFEPSVDGQTLGTFSVRTGNVERMAVLDPQVTGIVASGWVSEVWVGARRLAVGRSTVDRALRDTEIRIGLDVLWTSDPIFDERAGTLTLGRPPGSASELRSLQQLPFVLTFPGLSLVVLPGRPPLQLQGSEAREFLRGTRWQLHAANATVVILR